MSAPVALSLCSHPDDAEILLAGTLSLLHDKGWTIHIATMTAGDCGSKTLPRDEISAIRKAEAANAAALMGGEYSCLGCGDLFVLYDQPTINKCVELVRRVRPQIVFTHNPECYMVDHTNTAQLAMSACFAAGVPNIETESEPYDAIPHLYYADAIEGKNRFGEPVVPHLIVNISAAIDDKREMLCCHASQREWLFKHHGMDEYVESMEDWARRRGRDIGVKFGEGFRQHRGHAFPQDNRLKKELGKLVHERG